MITKEEAKRYIEDLSARGILSREEVLSAYDEARANYGVAALRKLNISDILSYLGGAIVFLGISILVWQNWDSFNTLTKIFITFGSGAAAYVVGMLFGRDEETEGVSSAFYLISALLMPTGLGVIFENAGFDVGEPAIQALVASILLSIYLPSYFVFRKTLFIFFSIIFGSWLFFALTDWVFATGLPYESWRFYAYRFMVLGISYMLLGYNFSRMTLAPLTGFLYNFGLLAFFGSALALTEWRSSYGLVWELIFPILIFGAIFLSVRLKAKSFLVWGTIFLMIYILKITSEYFANTIGWPLSLIFAGMALIGIGYTSVSVKKKYLS